MPKTSARRQHRREPNKRNQTSFIRVLHCPADAALGICLYDAGRIFDRTSFTNSLRDGHFPCGMVVELNWREEAVKAMVYTRPDGEVYLHQIDSEGLLKEQGVCLFPSPARNTPQLQEREYVCA